MSLHWPFLHVIPDTWHQMMRLVVLQVYVRHHVQISDKFPWAISKMFPEIDIPVLLGLNEHKMSAKLFSECF